MFGKVLVLNRGEIACRVLRTCKRLGVTSVAVYSDADASAPHVALADEAFRLGPAPVRESYLNLDAVRAVLAAARPDAVHPGYGLLSENARLARAVAEAGAVFVGPPPEALEALGDKVSARRIAREAGVPPPPGSAAAIDPADRAAVERELAAIGLPLLVKAAAGGGGIGMVRVLDRAELEKALTSARDRAQQAFGDGRVYLERYVERPRHIEVQALVDAQGNAVALGERECSVQRRHQKVIEESPSPAAFFEGDAGAARRTRLFASALAVLAGAGYRNAGTIEFVASQNGEAYFLEVNARLQVEHPVTELVTGLDLVEAQLRIAAGEPLADEVKTARPNGHAVEVRVYAEDPARGFIPQPGRIERLELPAGEGIRVDAGIAVGLEITPHYDPLLAKIIAHGPTRAAALERLDRALAATGIELVGPKGPRVTNLAYLRRILANAEFQSGQYDTHLLERLGPA